MANKKVKLKTGDEVIVIAGNNKGQKGTVKQIVTDKDRVVIEGVNMVTKHVKPSASNPNGGIEKIEAAIHISNVKLVDPQSGEPTRVGRKMNDEGKLQRYSKKTGGLI